MGKLSFVFYIFLLLLAGNAYAVDMEKVSRALDVYTSDYGHPAVGAVAPAAVTAPKEINTQSVLVTPKVVAPRKPKESEFNIAFEEYNYKYQEVENGGDKIMNLKGHFETVLLSCAFRPPDMDTLIKSMVNVFRMELRIGVGTVDYTGGLMIFDEEGNYVADEPYQYSGKQDYMVEWRGLAGKEFYLSPSLVVTPYTGLGWRQLRDDKGDDPYAYDRDQRYVYLPVGVDIDKKYASGWGVGANAEYDFLLDGKQHSEDFVFKQHEGNGYRLSLRVVRELKKVELSVEPFYRYWHIEGSNIVGGFYEPENTTEELGVKIGAKF